MMNNNLQLFRNSELGEVRILNIDGKPYFVASDVARALGYSRPADAVKLHCKGTVKHSILTNGGNQLVNIIPEGDIYRLIIKSKLPSAEKFERWVFDEVLPAIRQTGGYIPVSQEDTEMDILAKALMVAQKTIERQAQELKELEPKAEGFDRWLNKDNTYTFEQVAEILSTSPDEHEFGLGIDISRVTLPKILRGLGVLSKHRAKGRYKNLPNKDFEQFFNVIFLEKGSATQTRVKPEGIKFVYSILKGRM